MTMKRVLIFLCYPPILRYTSNAIDYNSTWYLPNPFLQHTGQTTGRNICNARTLWGQLFKILKSLVLDCRWAYHGL